VSDRWHTVTKTSRGGPVWVFDVSTHAATAPCHYRTWPSHIIDTLLILSVCLSVCLPVCHIHIVSVYLTSQQMQMLIIMIMIRQFIRRRNTSMKSLQGCRTTGSRDECRTVPDGRPPLDQAQRTWATGPPLGSYETTSTIAIIITQPESWYSFYHPTEGRRLSRPRWLVIYPDGLPAREQSPIQVLTGHSVD